MNLQRDYTALQNTIKEQGKEISWLREENLRLKESDEKYRNLFNKTPVAISLATLDGKLLAGNKVMSDMTGYTIEELQELNLSDLYENPVYRKPLMEMLKKERTLINASMRLKRKNGTIYNTLLTLSRIHHSRSDDLYQCICIDISEFDKMEPEKKALQVRLEETRKLESIAVFAGGIAHQFNNALAAILGNVELLELTLSDKRDLDRYINPIKDTAYRMAGLTEQLLAYAMGTDFRPKAISPVDFIENTLHLVKPAIKPNITVNTEFADNINNVKADFSQLQMVFSAIISNSSEAIKDTGNIWITCRDIYLNSENTDVSPDLAPGEYVKISITDDGKGMDENTRNRIFEPFFSTKFYGHGLGMATVYGIIRKHGGYITIESTEDKGTSVHIYLKALEKEDAGEKDTKEELQKGTGNILLIEDDPIVMEVNQVMIENLGYSILKAKTGIEAIEIAKSFNEKIDLAILDVLLPDMGGDEVYSKLMEVRPEMPVIISSGYSSDGPARSIIDAGAQGFLQKPFSFKSLSDKINEILS